ncbi:MAG: DUF3795 domain-containing protein [Promethearchaeota archaeon]
MTNIVAYCGIDCSKCPTYIATQYNNNKMRENVVIKWKKDYNLNLSIDDVNCDGCLNDKRIMKYCSYCRVRKCAKKKNLKSCAYCESFLCKTLKNLHKQLPPEYKLEEKLIKMKPRMDDEN